jgi:predicted ribosome quality control (RQC) complex YloA/Tae2 family protein
VDELQFLNGGIIESICHKDKDMTIRIMQEKPYVLFISPDILCLKDKGDITEVTDFAMMLRKYMRGKKITSIKQHNFDRIVELWTDNNALILELDNANYILCERSYKIIRPREFQRFDDRNVVEGETYVYPKSLDIRNINDLTKLLSSNEPVIHLLMNFLGKYARDILIIAKIKRDKISNQLTEEEKKRLINNINLFTLRKRNPQIVYEGRKMDLLLFDLETRKAEKKKQFDSYIEALDYYLTREEEMKKRARAEKKKLRKLRKKRIKKKLRKGRKR